MWVAPNCLCAANITGVNLSGRLPIKCSESATITLLTPAALATSAAA